MSDWIQVDCELKRKGNFIKVVHKTGLREIEVLGLMVDFWMYVQMHHEDGYLNADLEVLQHLFDCDETFWRAMEECNWIQFEGDKVFICGWEDRFSKAAKQRAMTNRRVTQHRKNRRENISDQDTSSGKKPTDVTQERYKCNAPPLQGAQTCNGTPLPEERRREEKRSIKPRSGNRSKAKPGISWNDSEGFQGITDADRESWASAYPAADLKAELAKMHEWLLANPTRAHRKAWRRFVTSWLSKCQDSGGTHRGAAVASQRVLQNQQKRQDEWKKLQPGKYRRPGEAVALAKSLQEKKEELL